MKHISIFNKINSHGPSKTRFIQKNNCELEAHQEKENKVEVRKKRRNLSLI